MCPLVYFNLLYLSFCAVWSDCQPQSSLLVEVGCVSHRVRSDCRTPKLSDNQESSKLLGSKALMRPQRSRGGQCFSFAAEESSISQGLLVVKNPLMQIIWVPASKESQFFLSGKIPYRLFTCYLHSDAKKTEVQGRQVNLVKFYQCQNGGLNPFVCAIFPNNFNYENNNS